MCCATVADLAEHSLDWRSTSAAWLQEELVVAFRQDFLAAVEPQHLAASWDVRHAAPRRFGAHSAYATTGEGTESPAAGKDAEHASPHGPSS